ncbi:MAG: lysophospholipid acyltransferase family protein [Deltaproteobacteria bacterium]|nr:lysophospholipid acyltransferase family protein [Deltaproteobacteria bacterium]
MNAPVRPPLPWYGVALYHVLPVRRATVLANLQRVYGAALADAERVRLAQAFYAHVARCLVEIAADTLWPGRARVRIENPEAVLDAARAGRGVLLLTGHLGNWELAATRGLAKFPEYRGRFHVLRRPLVPAWLDRLVTARFRRAGLGVLAKKGALETLLGRLAANDAVVFLLDQVALGRDGVRAEFFGAPTGTFRSLAIIARSTGAPVLPLAIWRAADGTHVLRFEPALVPIDAPPRDWVAVNTRAYNAALERAILAHPEQWLWAHRRWKDSEER